jgi:integrase
MPFDARAAKLLQAGTHLILPEHPGLRLSATASRRSWVYRYKSPVDGGMRQIKLGEWPSMSYPQAAVEWEKKKGEREGGIDHSLQKRTARREAEAVASGDGPGVYKVRRLVEDYLSGHIDLHRKPKGRAEMRRLLTLHTGPIAERPADLLLRSEAFDLLQGLMDRPVLLGQVRQGLGAAWDYALDAGKLPEQTPNWWRQIMRNKLPRSKGKKIAGKHVGTTKRVLSEKELGTLINWLPNFSKNVADALTMYIWTGTRGSEIMSIEAGEITEEPSGWWWTVPKEKTKNAWRQNAMDLRVPLIGRAKTVVLRRREGTAGLLFPADVGDDRAMEQKVVQGAVYYHQPYCKTKEKKVGAPRPRLPVTHWSPHDLRRTVRTMLASMGCPNDVAESVLGHMQVGIVGVYNRHQYDDERLDWLTRLDVKLEQIAQQYPLGAAS